MPGFVEVVRGRAGLDTDARAEETATEVLRTLSEGVSHGEMADLVARLPDAVSATALETERARAEPPAFDEFLDRVADRLDVDRPEALRRSRAVMAALSETVGEDEVEDARSQLPPGYEELFQPGEALGADSFVEAVADTGAFESTPEAEKAAAATLAALGQRLSKGEAEDVAQYLPDQAADWLVPEQPPRARDISYDEFVSLVADKENAPTEAAERHANRVAGVLAEVVGEEEFDSMEAQLPETYDPMFE